MKYYFPLFFLLLSSHVINSFAQVITTNDGFEGVPAMATPPYNWTNCNDGHSTGDTQPGFFHSWMSASEGNTYVSLVTREINPPGSVETIFALLLIPFEKNRCYSFSIDLSLSHTFYASYNWEDYYFDRPCVLQIFGFQGDCVLPDTTELLWQSEELHNYSWQTFDVDVRPALASYDWIAIRPFFNPDTNFKNSVVLIDNLQYRFSEHVMVEDNGICTIPEGSEGIHWYFNDQYVPGVKGIQGPAYGSGLYSATFFDENGCFIRASQFISIDADEVSCFPNPTSGEISLEAFSTEPEIWLIRIFNEIGQLVNSKTFESGIGKNRCNLNLSELSPSCYNLVIERAKKKTRNFKLVLMKND